MGKNEEREEEELSLLSFVADFCSAPHGSQSTVCTVVVGMGAIPPFFAEGQEEGKTEQGRV